MSLLKPLAFASFALVLFTARPAEAQNSGGYALGYSSYAMNYAQMDDQMRSTDLTKRAYDHAYYAHYYAYYGYYTDRSYFGFTHGLAVAAHDSSLDNYNMSIQQGNPNPPNMNAYYSQYYSSLAASYAYKAFFNQ